MNDIIIGDRVVWDEVGRIANKELYRKNLKDYGEGPFEVVEMDERTLTVAKGGCVLKHKDTNETVRLSRCWFKKAA